jgi:hypothetical protein
MSKIAKLADGTTLNFPDETPDAVMDQAVKKYLVKQSPPEGEGTGPIPRFASRAWEMINPIPAVVAGAKTIRDIPGYGPGGAIAKNLIKPILNESAKKIKEVSPDRTTGQNVRSISEATPVFGPIIGSVAGDISSGNYAGAAGTAAGLLLPIGLTKLAKVSGLPKALRSLAEDQYARVLSPGRQIGDKAILKTIAKERVVPQALDRGVMATSSGSLEKKASDMAAECFISSTQ